MQFDPELWPDTRSERFLERWQHEVSYTATLVSWSKGTPSGELPPTFAGLAICAVGVHEAQSRQRETRKKSLVLARISTCTRNASQSDDQFAMSFLISASV